MLNKLNQNKNNKPKKPKLCSQKEINRIFDKISLKNDYRKKSHELNFQNNQDNNVFDGK